MAKLVDVERIIVLKTNKDITNKTAPECKLLLIQVC